MVGKIEEGFWKTVCMREFREWSDVRAYARVAMGVHARVGGVE